MSENLLRHETSPYLLQHRDNPVHWRGWSEAALAEAQRLDRPILLSVGYAACHWCHVMAHESFEDEPTAAVMNALFVNIKVDREERPDIDQIYMAALHALGEQGGWPLTMFLTPDGRPIWGGTYFPKIGRYGRPGFVDVMQRVASLYATERDTIIEQAQRLTEHLRTVPRQTGSPALDSAFLDQAADAVLGIFDLERGGTRGAPKFPNFSALEFLARSAERTGRADLRQAVTATLSGLTRGGIYDHFGGGLARYSTDERWLAPHFEKMLSDNGLLLQSLASQITPTSVAAPDDSLRDRIESTIGWLQREMLLGNGLFAASLDADSDGHEGAFYVWQRHELDEILTAADAGFIAALYDITPGGNWEGASIPNRLGAHPPLNAADESRRLRLIETLRQVRERRPRPARDDKQLADWNGFVIAGLAMAAFLLGRADWLQLAERAFTAAQTVLLRDGRPAHAHREGRLVSPGFSTDSAALAHAAVALHLASQKEDYLEAATDLLNELERHHSTGDGGFYFTADDAETLIQRRSDRQDDAAPNAHSLAAEALVRIWSLTGNDSFRERADRIFDSAAGNMAANVFGTASLLAALDLRLRIRSVVILAQSSDDAEPLRRAVTDSWRSNLTLDVRIGATALPATHPAHGRTAIGGRATAYLCREGACSLPIQDPADLTALLTEG